MTDTPGMPDTLTAEMITELLSSGRARGQYLPVIEAFVSSEQPGIDVMTNPIFKGKSAQSVANSFNGNIAKYATSHPDGPALVCKYIKPNRVLLVNKDALALAVDTSDDE